MRSETRYFSAGTIIADSHEPAQGLMVITSGALSPRAIDPPSVLPAHTGGSNIADNTSA